MIVVVPTCMTTINLAILNGQIGNFYLPKVRDYRQLDSTVHIQGSIPLRLT